MSDIDYKFREDELIQEFSEYIDKTYSGHYGQGELQSSEVIIDRGHGMGFFLGNVDKYNGRYGKKGLPNDYRKDLMKILHYGFLALFEHDRCHGVEKKELSDLPKNLDDYNFKTYSGGDQLDQLRTGLDGVDPHEWSSLGSVWNQNGKKV